MKLIHFARHGETVWHAENRYAGLTDIALTDRGVRQAQALAVWAITRPITLVVSSDLARAVNTALPAAAALGLELNIDPRLREVDFGRGEGLTSAEMNEAFPDPFSAFLETPASVPLPDGESGVHALARAIPVIREVHESNASEVLIVAHNTLCRILLCGLIGIPLDSYRRVFPRLLNGAITTIGLPDKAQSDDELLNSASLLAFNIPLQ